MRSPSGAALLVVLLAGVGPVWSHPGLHHDIERMTEAIERSPGSPDLHVERAYYERLDGKLEEALRDLEAAHTLDPANRRVPAERGMTLSAMGRDAEAERELSKFLAQGSGTAITFAERAVVRKRLGRKAEAVADYTSAIRLRPDVEYYINRGALQELEGDLDGAATGYREGLARLGSPVSLRLALIRAEVARKRPDAAIAEIDRELDRVAVKTDWYLRRAEVQETFGRKASARSDRERALAEANRIVQTNPTGIHLLSRARAYAALGRTEDARNDLDTVLTKSPRYAEAREFREQLAAANLHKGMKP